MAKMKKLCIYMYIIILVSFSVILLAYYMSRIMYPCTHEGDYFGNELWLSSYNISDRDMSLATGAKRYFVMSNDGQIFILGVTAVNATTDSVVETYNVYGHVYDPEQDLKCCLKYFDGEISQLPIEKHLWPPDSSRYYISKRMTALPSFNVICGIPKEKELPVRMSVVYKGHNCTSYDVGYVRPYYPMRQTGTKLVMTTKISHRNVPADLLVAWFETYLWLGVDKVVTYAMSNLATEARAVMEYYAKKHVLDLYDYELPELDKISRNRDRKGYQEHTDGAVVMYDANARYAGYTYFSVIDWDEFIIPSGNRTLKQLLEKLFYQDSGAAGFLFMTQYYITSAQPENNDVFLKRFVHRLNAPPTYKSSYMTQKMIFKPALARVGSSHSVIPIAGYNGNGRCGLSDAFTRHYRRCIPKRSTRGVCYAASDLDLIEDREMAQWSDNIVENIRRAKASIFPPKH